MSHQTCSIPACSREVLDGGSFAARDVCHPHRVWMKHRNSIDKAFEAIWAAFRDKPHETPELVEKLLPRLSKIATAYAVEVPEALERYGFEYANAHNPTHVLYRFFSDSGDLLYVGITNNPGQRIKQHENGQSWWAQVVSAKMEHFSSREELAAAELQAIRTENPRYNVAGKVAA